VVRIFPTAESCLRLVRALAMIHELWIETMRYLNMALPQRLLARPVLYPRLHPRDVAPHRPRE